MKNSGSKEEAKDIYQNTLLAFYKNIKDSNFTLHVKLSTYLFSISKNLWLKELRNRSKLKTEQLLDNEQLSEENSPSQKEELLVKMTTGLKKLSDNCQKLIKLYYYESKPWSEIMHIMNYKNEHAARNQKYKCFQKLKQHIL